MTDKQPEALRLADWLFDNVQHINHADAAAELRSLHAANIALMAERNELLEALKVLADEVDGFNVSGVYFNEKCMGHKGLDMAYAAIAKATGENK